VKLLRKLRTDPLSVFGSSSGSSDASTCECVEGLLPLFHTPVNDQQPPNDTRSAAEAPRLIPFFDESDGQGSAQRSHVDHSSPSAHSAHLDRLRRAYLDAPNRAAVFRASNDRESLPEALLTVCSEIRAVFDPLLSSWTITVDVANLSNARDKPRGCTSASLHDLAITALATGGYELQVMSQVMDHLLEGQVSPIAFTSQLMSA